MFSTNSAAADFRHCSRAPDNSNRQHFRGNDRLRAKRRIAPRGGILTHHFDEIDQLAVTTIRTLSMDAVEQAGSGHPGAPMGLAPVAYVLY